MHAKSKVPKESVNAEATRSEAWDFKQLDQTHLYQHPLCWLCPVPKCKPQHPNLEQDLQRCQEKKQYLVTCLPCRRRSLEGHDRDSRVLK